MSEFVEQPEWTSESLYPFPLEVSEGRTVNTPFRMLFHEYMRCRGKKVTKEVMDILDPDVQAAREYWKNYQALPPKKKAFFIRTQDALLRGVYVCNRKYRKFLAIKSKL